MSNSFTFSSDLPPLNVVEEIVLAKTIENGILANRELKLGNVDSKRKDFLKSEINKAIEARNHLVLSNSHLVVSIAKLFLHRGVELEDLIQEGQIGLIKAAERFDYRNVFGFSTYAKRWIRESIYNSIWNQIRINNPHVNNEKQLISLLRPRQSLSQKYFRKLSNDEFADTTKLIEEKVTKHLYLSTLCFSLDAICESTDFDLHENDIFPDSFPCPSISASFYFQKRFVDSILASLPEIQCFILKYKYGLIDGSLHTNQEISKFLNLSLWQVKHNENLALRKLRKIVSPIEASDNYID